MLEYLDRLDTELFLALNSLHNGFFDRVMWFFSGRAEWIPLYILILGWIIFRYRKRSVLVIVAVIILIALSDQLSVQVKLATERLRPCKEAQLRPLIHLVNGYCGGKYGFVSSHAANSFAVAVFTSLLLKNRFYVIFILLWSSLVSYSRIYLGVHYPGDILGGAILGTLLAWGVYGIYSYSEKKLTRSG
jgi:undecaprenyl-diphosphatase